MSENGISKALRVIGIIEIVCGVICGFILIEEFVFFLASIIVGIVSGMMFFGFAEIINLLQRNADQQKEILDHMKDIAYKEKNASKSLIQDIEENLPNM